MGVIFTIDATQSVIPSVSILYQSILTKLELRQSWIKEGSDLTVLVVCTKSDVKGAKNCKRIRLAVRRELGRLQKIDLAMAENGNNGRATLGVTGKSIDLQNLGDDVPVSLHFMEAGFGGKAPIGAETIRNFVLSGELPK